MSRGCSRADHKLSLSKWQQLSPAPSWEKHSLDKLQLFGPLTLKSIAIKISAGWRSCCFPSAKLENIIQCFPPLLKFCLQIDLFKQKSPFPPSAWFLGVLATDSFLLKSSKTRDLGKEKAEGRKYLGFHSVWFKISVWV